MRWLQHPQYVTLSPRENYDLTSIQVLQLGSVIPLFLAMKQGLGKSDQLLNDSSIAVIGKVSRSPYTTCANIADLIVQLTFAAQIVLILAIATAKCSVAALMLRLFTRDM